jgi:ferrous iron transport protein A
MLKLSELKVGESATVYQINDEKLIYRLMELGLLPGELVKVEYIAPLGDPIAITVSNYQLSMRLSDADKVMVEKLIK